MTVPPTCDMLAAEEVADPAAVAEAAELAVSAELAEVAAVVPAAEVAAALVVVVDGEDVPVQLDKMGTAAAPASPAPKRRNIFLRFISEREPPNCGPDTIDLRVSHRPSVDRQKRTKSLSQRWRSQHDTR